MPRGRLRETILVPFAPQSPLSGIHRPVQHAFYRRTFTVPGAWRGRRVLLHFGAVTHRAEVRVNGRVVGRHAGSYDAFTLDVTARLRPGANRLEVTTEDTAQRGGHPNGKQYAGASSSLYYTPSSGIWQTVWLEAVAATHVTALRQVPDPDRARLLVTATVAAGRGATVVLRARDGRRVVGTVRGPAGGRLALPVPVPKLWSPDRPFLYDLDVEVRRGTRVVDRARSYFGMRTVAVRGVGAHRRIVLNGKPVFQVGLLDQGYWPDGLYTAPTDAALAGDIRTAKAFGFNTLRKHLKVEPERWYAAADRLGLLVWQDFPSMPSGTVPTPENQRGFRREYREWMAERGNHPSVVMWVPFNEGWGQHAVSRITDEVGRLDPGRIVDGQSGSANCCGAVEPRGGDVRDTHLYQGPFSPPPDGRRALVIGEFGSPYRRIPGHLFRPGSVDRDLFEAPVPTAAAHLERLTGQYELLRQEMRQGLSGAIFVELTDVEDEYGGLVTYDRRVDKVGRAGVRALNAELLRASEAVLADPAPAPAVPAGQVAHWTFDEGDGTVAGDAVGGRSPLTLGPGTGWTPGRFGNALYAAGAGAGARRGGPVLDTGGDYTVSAWVRPARPDLFGSAVSQAGERNAALSLGLVRGRFAFTTPARDAPTPELGFGGGGPGDRSPYRASNNYIDRFVPAVGAWHHVVAVRRRATRSITLFLDGRTLDSRHAPSVARGVGDFVVGGGTMGGPGPDAFRGAVDEVRAFDRALTAAEVEGLDLADRATTGCTLAGAAAACPGVPTDAAAADAAGGTPNRLTLAVRSSRSAATSVDVAISPGSPGPLPPTADLDLRLGAAARGVLTGFGTCRRERLVARGPSACPAGSRVGGGQLDLQVDLGGSPIPVRTDDVRLFRGAAAAQVLLYAHTTVGKGAPATTSNYVVGTLEGDRLRLDLRPVTNVAGAVVALNRLQLTFDRRLFGARPCTGGGTAATVATQDTSGRRSSATARVRCP